MIQPEGPGEPEFVETDLSKDEGLPTARADVPPIPLGGSESGRANDGAAPRAGDGGRQSDISFIFRTAGVLLRVRNRSSENSATHRAMAASIPIAVTLFAAVVFAKLFLDSMNATMAVLVILLMVLVGFYLALRVIAEPVERKPGKTKKKGKRKG